MRRTVLLCLVEHNPLRCEFVHMDRRCGDVSISFCEHRV